jgi:hypothetical protein
MAELRASPRSGLLVAVLLSVGLSATALLAAFSGRASAASYVVQPCSGTAPFTAWQSTSGAAGWTLTSSCPTQMAVGAAVPTTGSRYWHWPGAPSSNRKVLRVDATLSGDDGSAYGKEQGIRVAGDWWAEIYGRCKTVDPCPGSPERVISNIRVTFEDNWAPTLTTLLPDYAATFLVGWPMLRPGEWQNEPSIKINWRAKDSGGGITHSILRSTTGVEQRFDSGCGGANGPYKGFCSGDFYNETLMQTGDVTKWRQGPNTATITTSDMAGQQASQTIDFKLDTVAPAHPAWIAIRGANERGWITGESFDVSWGNTSEEGETETQSGVVGAEYALGPIDVDFGYGTGGAVDLPAISELQGIETPPDGIWELMLQTRDRAGNVSEWSQTTVKVEHLVLEAPRVSAIGWVNRDQLRNGVAVGWQRPANLERSRAGICGYSHAIDPSGSTSLDETVDLPGDVDELRLRQLLDSGRHYLHVRAVSCAGVAGETAIAPINVDVDAPEAALNPSTADWWPGATRASISASDAASGVERIEYSIDGGAFRNVDGANADVQLPHGRHVLAYTAVDVAGNRAETESVVVRIDDVEPIGVIEDQDRTRPAEVNATVHDADSGIARAWLEYESIEHDDEGSRQFSRVFAAEGEMRTMDISARLPVAELLPGPYRIKVVAIDRTGNVSVSSVRRDGSDAAVVAPLLETPSLSAGFEVRVQQRCGRNSRCRRQRPTQRATTPRLFVQYGRGATLAGRLTHASGEPIADTRLRLLDTVAYATGPRLLTSAVTDTRGRFRVAVPRGPSRLFEVRYDGSDLMMPTKAQASLLTHGSARLSVRPSALTSSQPFVLSGRVRTGGAELPSLGKRIQLEYRARRGWRPFESSVQTDPDGRFRLRATLPGLKRTIRMRFRARIEREDGWPFATGHSNTVDLIVRPR